MDGMMVKLKEVLNRELKARNESLNNLARRCKIPPATLHGWLNGTVPNAKNLHLMKALSKYLGISLSVLLFNEKEESSTATILFSSTFIDEDNQYRLSIEKIPKSERKL
jgi:transcriptional regulator with XRE-family HTH domain